MRPVNCEKLHCKKGAEIVEFGLVIIPLLAFVLLIVDIAWVLFAQSTLQHAVSEGVRYAVTSQTMAGKRQDASIDAVIINNAFGFVTAATVSNVAINYFNPATLAATTSNAGGNVVQIVISGVNVYPLGPIWRSKAALVLSARSSDVMEASPGGIPPAR
jgi:Flp pilus assembly protein TadG